MKLHWNRHHLLICWSIIVKRFCNICLFNIHQCHWEVPLGAIAHNRNILHSTYMKWHTRRSRDVKRTEQYFNLLFTIRHIKTAYGIYYFFIHFIEGLIIHALNTLKIINVLSAYTYTHTHRYMLICIATLSPQELQFYIPYCPAVLARKE